MSTESVHSTIVLCGGPTHGSHPQCALFADLAVSETAARKALLVEEALWRGNLMTKSVAEGRKLASSGKAPAFLAARCRGLRRPIPPAVPPVPTEPVEPHTAAPAPVSPKAYSTVGVHNPYALDDIGAPPPPLQDSIDPPAHHPSFPFVSGAPFRPPYEAKPFSRDLQLPASCSFVPLCGRRRRPCPPPSAPTVSPLTPPVPVPHPVVASSTVTPAASPPPPTVASGGAEEVYPIGWLDNVPISVTRKGPPQPPPLPRVTPIASILHQYQETAQAS